MLLLMMEAMMNRMENGRRRDREERGTNRLSRKPRGQRAAVHSPRVFQSGQRSSLERRIPRKIGQTAIPDLHCI